MSDEGPFVGPRPYLSEDRDEFFGRDHEIAELLSLIVASRVLMLYAVSGAGKTSLLRAGLMPAVEEHGFEVLPPLRPQAPNTPPSDVDNVFAFAALSGWIDRYPEILGGDNGLGPSTTLAEVLDRIPQTTDPHGFSRPRLIVFDQFEEIFTSYQDRWTHRAPFIEQIAAAVETDPALRVMLSLREDYLAPLSRYANRVPGGLRTRFHLERLRRDAALRAVIAPMQGRGIEFAPNVAEQLIHDLLESRIDVGNGVTTRIEGEYVEPVQLQVVCRTLWDSLEPGVERVTAEQLSALGGVDDSLIRYYDEAIAAAAVAGGLRAPALRESLETALITSAGTRASLFAGGDTASGLPAAALDELAHRHLIRAEWRAGARWLELAHDRLIEPVREANRRVRGQRRRRVRRRSAVGISVLLPLAGAAMVFVWTGQDASIPRVIGAANVSDAERKLTRAGFEVGRIAQRETADVDAGTVFAQSPSPGAQRHKGSAVNLTVAVLSQEVTNPRVVGLSLKRAGARLTSAGLSVGAVSPRTSTNAVRVTGQIPAAGKLMKRGATVDLFIAARATKPRDDWNDGPALTVLLSSVRSESGALALKRELRAKGIPAGVLRSGRYESLRPGYWVVFAGHFKSRGDVLRYELDLKNGINASGRNARGAQYAGAQWSYVAR